MSWRTRSPTEQNNDPSSLLPVVAADLASEVLNLQGQAKGAPYVLQMDYSNEVETPADQVKDIGANKNLFLGMLVNSGKSSAQWENAVTGNTSVGAYAWQPSDQTETLASNYVSPAAQHFALPWLVPVIP